MVFDTLRDKLIIVPILHFPSWDKPFHVHVDASGTAIEEVLSQPSEGIVDHPLCFASRKLTPTEKIYTNTKHKELLMIYKLYKFR